MHLGHVLHHDCSTNSCLRQPPSVTAPQTDSAMAVGLVGNRNRYHNALVKPARFMARVCRAGWAALLLGMVWPIGLTPPTAAQEVTAPASPPLWQQGISRWSGTEYVLPAASNATPPASDQSKGYTVPVDPQSMANPEQVIPFVSQPTFNTPPSSGSALVQHASGDISGIASTIQPTVAQQDLPAPVLPPPSGTPTPSATLGGPIMNAPIVPQGTFEMPDDFTLPGDAVLPGEVVLPGQVTDQIGSGMTYEEPPLQEEVVRWYQYPWRWFRQGWENHAEFGLDGSDGNADTLAIQTGLELKRKTDAYTLSIDVDYRQASSRGVNTEDNARFNLDYDRLLADSSWSAFGKFGLEYDDFKAFDLRVNLNSGLGYYWIRNDQTSLVTRFGAGASKEIDAPVDDWIAEAVFGIEAEHQLNSRNKLKGKLDYFPAWEDFSDYRLVTDLAWEILLNDSENFSLKLAVTDRYDSTPQGALANDVYYSMLLLYKF